MKKYKNKFSLIIIISLFLQIFTVNLNFTYAVTPNFEIRLDESSPNLEIVDYSDKGPSWIPVTFFVYIPESSETIQLKLSENRRILNDVTNKIKEIEADTWTTINLEEFLLDGWMYDEYLSLDSSFTHYYFSTNMDYNELVFVFQVGGSTSNTTDKTALQAAINTDVSGYYDSDDRWNGTEYTGSGKSFYNLYAEALNSANTVNNNPDIAKNYIDEATSELISAIARLISKDNVNATLLYEKVHSAKAFEENRYTVSSWSDFENKLADAEYMLETLYDNDGKPEDINVSTYQAEVDSMTAELDAAIKGLEQAADESNADAALRAYNDIKNLARLFNPANMNEDDYTSESWDEFIASRDAAMSWVNSNPAPSKSDSNIKLRELINDIHPKFQHSCYFGLKNKENSINVSLKIVNTLAAREDYRTDGSDGLDGYFWAPLDGKPENKRHDISGYYNTSISLSEGKHTIGDAIDAASRETGRDLRHASFYDTEKVTSAIAVYVNGVLYRVRLGDVPSQSMNVGETVPDVLGYYEYFHTQDFILRDGDEVVFAFLQQPSEPASSGANYQTYKIDTIIDKIKHTRIMEGSAAVEEITVREGEKFTLRAENAPALSSIYGAYTSFSGGTLFVSGLSDTESSFIPAVHKTNVVTDSDGSFTYSFYGQGWYTIGVYDLRANNYANKELYGLTAGDVVRVHVLPSGNPEVLKQKILSDLREVYEEYDESFFTAMDWAAITKIYEDAVEAINAETDLYKAGKILNAAVIDIKNIQSETLNDNNAKLKEFRRILSRLPEDVLALGKSSEFLAQELVRIYGTMSEYQRNLLTGIEDRLYKEIKTSYDAGLPELEPYELKLEINADTPEANAAIEDMMSYILINSQHVNKPSKGLVNERTLRGDAVFPTGYFSLYNVTSPVNSLAYVDESLGSTTTSAAIMSMSVSTPSGILASTPYKIYPDRRVQIYTGIDTSIHFFDEVSGTNWMILNDGPDLRENTGDNSAGSVAVRGKTILIGGVPYEVKSISAEGISFEYGWDSLEDPSVVGYKNKHILYEGVSRIFIMPYDNVTVKINWGPVDGTAPGEEQLLGKAKAEAIDSINNAFGGYRSVNYDDNNWDAIVSARNTGIEEVRKSSTIEQVRLARDNAIAAMAAIEKKAFTGTTPFGKVVGKVDVYAENTTFSGGAFRGTFIEKEGYEFGENDTMMTVILRALSDEGFSWTGTGSAEEYKIEYLASISKNGKSLGEFSGEPGSGWMGTLNDFFVNEGFQHFSYKNGKLEDGDEIRLMFTQNLGVDLGGTWGNSDTSLADLKLSTGKLYPAFDSGTYNYTLVMPSTSGRVKVTPTASNKNYLVKTFLNDKVTTNKESSSFYKRTRHIPVKSGDYINIGVGEYAWPSMNNQETEARSYAGSWYRLDIISPDKGADRVISLINALPSVKRIDLSHEDEVKSIRSIYNMLTSSEQARVNNIDKLKEAEAKIEFVRQIENVKTLLEKIPAASKVTLKDKQTVMDADAAYKKLTDEQKLYITVGDVKNYNDAIDKLTELGAFDSGSAPSKIVGSDAVPVIEGGTIDVKAETKVVNKEATSKVTDKQIKDAIAEAQKAEDVSSITIQAETKEEITKSTVVVPKSSIAEISGARLDLKVETPVGTISMPEKALTEIARQAQGSSVEIVIENIAADKLTDEQKASVGGSVVYDISIISGGKSITSFGGQKITISLPYTLKAGEKAENVTVWYMNDKGKLEKISCKYDEKTELATFTTDHLSYYVVGYENKISFVDVTENDWFYKYVMYAVQKGLFSGTGENTFSPDMPMTRSMLVTVLYRMEGSPAVTYENAFTDVDNGQWYTEAVIWANSSDIVTGYGKGKFGTNDPITREQMAVILYRYAQTKGYDVTKISELTTYTDASSVSTWSEPAVKWAVSQGLITGTSSTTLSPTGTATRAQVAAILQRYIENVK